MSVKLTVEQLAIVQKINNLQGSCEDGLCASFDPCEAATQAASELLAVGVLELNLDQYSHCHCLQDIRLLLSDFQG